MERDATHLGTANLDLTGMEPRTDLQADCAECSAYRARAAHGATRAVEGGDDSVAGVVHLLPAEPLQLGADEGVMGREEVTPASIAHLSQLRRGAHQICVQDRCE